MSKPIEWLYLNNEDNSVRYVLGEKGKNMLACVGINPSTAKPDDLDNTLKSVKRIAEFNGFDGWIMYNVYPQRATDPNELHSEIDHDLRLTNCGVLSSSIKALGIKNIWVAYGDLIESRDYLRFCMADLYRNLNHHDLKWKIISEPTKKGHPRHPLYKATKSILIDYDMERYTDEKLKPFSKEFEKIFIDGREFK